MKQLKTTQTVFSQDGRFQSKNWLQQSKLVKADAPPKGWCTLSYYTVQKVYLTNKYDMCNQVWYEGNVTVFRRSLDTQHKAVIRGTLQTAWTWLWLVSNIYCALIYIQEHVKVLQLVHNKLTSTSLEQPCCLDPTFGLAAQMGRKVGHCIQHKHC